MYRISICDWLLKRNEIEPFLKRLITGDEKWIKEDNNVRNRSWSKQGEASNTIAKLGLASRKVILPLWWDWKKIIHYELLQPGQTIDSSLYCQQLLRLKKTARINQQKGQTVVSTKIERAWLGVLMF